MSRTAANEISQDAVVVLSDLDDIYLNKCRTKNGTEGFCLWKKKILLLILALNYTHWTSIVDSCLHTACRVSSMCREDAEVQFDSKP